jgi:hypothetical protein
MAEAKLILKKHARGDYEIGIQTEDGAVVARVCILDGTAIDTRSETEREEAALEKAARLRMPSTQRLDEANLAGGWWAAITVYCLCPLDASCPPSASFPAAVPSAPSAGRSPVVASDRDARPVNGEERGRCLDPS